MSRGSNARVVCCEQAEHGPLCCSTVFTGIVRAALIPVDVVRRRSTYIEHTNSHRFMLQDNVWDAPQVIDATARLRAIL